jgi:hypothetical protein
MNKITFSGLSAISQGCHLSIDDAKNKFLGVLSKVTLLPFGYYFIDYNGNEYSFDNAVDLNTLITNLAKTKLEVKFEIHKYL